MLKVLFPGSFDPFHIGHLYFYKKLAKKYDVYILISNNPNKNNSSFHDRYQLIKKIFINNNINLNKIIINYGLTVDIANLLNIKYIVRSWLNINDLKYELNLKRKYKKLNKNIKIKLFYISKNKKIRSSKIN